jgi:TolA-binding protein
MEAETLLALGDALAAQGRQDAACDAWQRASLIFSAIALPQNKKVQSRLLANAGSHSAG